MILSPFAALPALRVTALAQAAALLCVCGVSSCSDDATTTQQTTTDTAAPADSVLADTAVADTVLADGSAIDGVSATDTAADTGLADGTALDSVLAADTAADTAAAETTASACPPADLLLAVATGKGAGSGYPAATIAGTCTDKTFTVTSHGMPFYTYVAMTPNALKAVQQSWTIPRQPALAATTTDLPLLGVAGFTVAGIPFYGPNEATQPADEIYGDPVYNGLMDGCMAHTSPQEYHNHAIAEKCLTKQALASAEPWALPEPAATTASPIIGWALDGFAVYGPRGCLDAACSKVVTFQSGWVKTGDPKTYAWKAYTYTAKPDDPTVLDKCNGRTGPDGVYRYHATSGFPYIMGCYSGTPATQAGGGMTDPGGGTNPTGPATCTATADCTGKCPPGSKGCSCETTPQGKLCIPTCTTNADCGNTPTGQKTTCQQGTCKP